MFRRHEGEPNERDFRGFNKVVHYTITQEQKAGRLHESGTLDQAEIEKKIEEAELAKQAVSERINVVSVPALLKSLEKEFLKYEKQIEELEKEKQEKKNHQINMEIVLEEIKKLVEHFEYLLLGSSDPLKNAAFFCVIFQTPPTYDELVGGTPQLEPIIKLNEEFKQTHSLNVDDEGFEPPTSSV